MRYIKKKKKKKKNKSTGAGYISRNSHGLTQFWQASLSFASVDAILFLLNTHISLPLSTPLSWLFSMARRKMRKKFSRNYIFAWWVRKQRHLTGRGSPRCNAKKKATRNVCWIVTLNSWPTPTSPIYIHINKLHTHIHISILVIEKKKKKMKKSLWNKPGCVEDSEIIRAGLIFFATRKKKIHCTRRILLQNSPFYARNHIDTIIQRKFSRGFIEWKAST